MPLSAEWHHYFDLTGEEGHDLCVAFVAEATTGLAASSMCAALDSRARLASVHSASLLLFLGAKAGAGSWVGAFFSPQQWGWQWADGSTATSLNCGVQGCGLWAPNEPGGNLDVLSCAIVHQSGLDDSPCSTLRPFICSYATSTKCGAVGSDDAALWKVVAAVGGAVVGLAVVGLAVVGCIFSCMVRHKRRRDSDCAAVAL